MKLFVRSKQTVSCLRNSAFLTVVVIVCFAVSERTQGVAPAPDGGYPGGNTAEGQNALLSLTTGGFNTAVGLFSLRSNTTSSFNTATGAGTLLVNTADQNTAFGAGALLSNSTGSQNVANGTFALFNNTFGNANTANGAFALLNNTTGGANTAIGNGALLGNTTGSDNIGLGIGAGGGITTADNITCIGTLGQNVSNSCYIGRIFNSTSSGGTAVFINADGKLGTTTSSRRFKENIKPMEQASEALFALKPVVFHYKKEIDPQSIPQFGLVAEEVEAVNSDLVVRDKEGKPYTVRHEAVNAMLLNEFLKEHSKVKEQQATITELKSTIAQQKEEFRTAIAQQRREMEGVVARFKEQDAKIQRVSAQLELNKPTPQTVSNNR
jgi:uncharacterized coiled-coil protein SlyX